MTSPSDQVYADQFETLFRHIIKCPGMYASGGSYDAVTSLINGMDLHSGGLVGLHQWLVVKLDGYNSVAWPASIIELSDDPIPWPVDSKTDNERAIRLLGSTLVEFFEYRRTNGLTKIFYDYGNWLLSQKWYDGPLRSST